MTVNPPDIQRLIATRRAGHTLEAPFYTAPEIFNLDMELIFSRHWIFVGVEPEVPEAGDYIIREIGKSSVIIVRDDDEVVRAYFNVCRHRGARLVNEPSGTVGKLVCPYHQWTYELTGELIDAPHMGDGFDMSCRSLKPVHLRSIEGLLFVCLSDNPPADIEDMAKTMGPRIAPHALRATKVAAQFDLIEQGNWKLVMENNRECYHCTGSHPELTVSLSQFGFGFEPNPNDAACVADAAAYDAEQKRLTEEWEARGFPSRAIDHLADTPTGYRSERLILAGAGESQTLDTKIASRRLLGGLTEPKLGGLHYWTQPNSWHHFMSDHAVVFAVFPLTAETTLLRTIWLVHKDAVEGVDYDVENLTRVWNATNAQDGALVALAQKGATDLGYEPGPYSPLTENFVEQNCEWYIGRMAEHLAGAR